MAKEISKELIRQIEIISMVLAKPRHYSEYEIAAHFGESITTVRRDFASIRETGINIHSSKKLLVIMDKIPAKLLNKLINTYLALNDTDTIKNLVAIRKIFREKTLKCFVDIVQSINLKRLIEFDYQKDESKITTKRYVTPVGFFKTNRSFILIGLENDDLERVRFYLIEKMQNIHFTIQKTAHKNLPNMYEFMKDSWGIYQSGELHDVELLFDKSCSSVKNRVYVNTQHISDTTYGILFSAKLKVTREFISWILGWGGKCKVIKPISLKNEIVKTAKDILKEY